MGGSLRTTHRKQLLEWTETKRGNLSFYLGGKEKNEEENWKPDLDAIKATIEYAMATGRLQ